MQYFTHDEFDKMFHEIINSNGSCVDTLMIIAERVLKGPVKKWCNNDSALKNRQFEEDLMQDIRARLMKVCVTGFFKRNDKENYDPNGFKNWLFTVAVNVKNDFAKKQRRIQFMEAEDADLTNLPSHQPEVFTSYSALNRLSNAFLIVLKSDSKVYKVLTWMAQMLIIANTNVTKIESNEILVNTFENMSLDEMLRSILDMSCNVPWLRFNDKQFAKVEMSLNKICSDGKRMGEKRYGDFFMKKGGKASVSDWVNRMNDLIAKEEKHNETSDS
ncbi:MAG: sigma-70 family RNA polymerase sigma factor [Clostridia bacterium]|nr:sigma-70 family RNA polymerase sigma factor [Clostridia bacterium]